MRPGEDVTQPVHLSVEPVIVLPALDVAAYRHGQLVGLAMGLSGLVGLRGLLVLFAGF